MDQNNILNNLNNQQLEAIVNVDGPCRIIAGAGVGKTRVLTTKIAYLIQAIKIPSEKILALTFTNKAAKEMRERVSSLVQDTQIKSTILTYHALCAKILRYDIHNLKINNNFNIIDQEDTRKILKDIYNKDFSHKTDLQELKILTSNISAWKNSYATKEELLDDFAHQPNWILRIKVFEKYQEYQFINSCLDFDDLLLLVNKLFHQFPNVLKKWQAKYQFILVDEFQDTNNIQYDLLLSLAKNHNNITVVGDPDQTIYTWRGANINLILNFEKHFPNTKTYILNQNYRSTTKILNTANSLIKNNNQRVDKTLFTDNNDGTEVVVYNASNSAQEAHWVANMIKKITITYNLSLNNIAILYRNNYLSKDLEQALVQNNIDYKIFGGFRFYERKEIRDIIAYLKIIAWNDNLSTNRILAATPKIGPKAINFLTEVALSKSLTLMEYIILYEANLPKNYQIHLQPIITLVKYFQKELANISSLHNLVEQIIKKTNYIETLKNNFETDRIDNIKQLLDQLIEFDSSTELQGLELLTNFLQEISLYTDLDEKNSNKAVNLMTIHSAKGLEFDVVFVVGINEGILPSRSVEFSNNKNEKLEEERRIFYVAITRAKKWLFLSSGDGFSYVLNTMKQPSRFFKDLEPQNLKIINNQHQELADTYINQTNKFTYSRPESKKGLDIKNDWKVNDIINHEIFGKGVVIKILGDKIQVAFHQSHGGIKIIAANHKGIKKFT